MNRDTIVHLLAGGLGGTAGAVVTCPLEVVKTRLQSSVGCYPHTPCAPPTSSLQKNAQTDCEKFRSVSTANSSVAKCRQNNIFSISARMYSTAAAKQLSLWGCLRHIVQSEGVAALWKGLWPNVVGVAPSRAIYFCAYSNTKKLLNSHWVPETVTVHMCSAAFAGFVTASITNPIWLVKTRLQLDPNTGAKKLSVNRCIWSVYEQDGLRGFYRGVTASYVGISETVTHFVIYEYLKSMLVDASNGNEDRRTRDFVAYMACGGVSKCIAATLCYPHEVARTRLREEGNKYRRFWSTLALVWREEGLAGMYRGLGVHLVRQIPNTAIMMAVYELSVYLMRGTT